MSRLDPNTPPDWRRHLAELPEVAPDESLWPRLQAARVAGRGTPRTRRPAWAWAAVAAAMIMAVVLVSALRAPVADPDARAVAGAMPLAEVAPVAVRAPVDAGLLQIDADIERAYARGADAADVAELWATRQRVALSLDSAAPVLVARL
jgi:hypothetical protein